MVTNWGFGPVGGLLFGVIGLMGGVLGYWILEYWNIGRLESLLDFLLFALAFLLLLFCSCFLLLLFALGLGTIRGLE